MIGFGIWGKSEQEDWALFSNIFIARTGTGFWRIAELAWQIVFVVLKIEGNYYGILNLNFLQTIHKLIAKFCSS